MKALILNSGLGSRMGDLTKKHPKCMTELLDNETIVSRQLRQLSLLNIKDVVMTVGYYDDVLRDYCDSLNLDLSITYVKNPIYRDTNYIYSIYCAKDYLVDDIILMHGDLVFDDRVIPSLLKEEDSCMTVSSTLELPEKDFKAVIRNDKIVEVGINCFDDALAAQPLYKINKKDWLLWLDNIIKYCDNNERKCYAENAFNEISDKCLIYPYDVKDMLCMEVDNPSDLENVKSRLEKLNDGEK